MHIKIKRAETNNYYTLLDISINISTMKRDKAVFLDECSFQKLDVAINRFVCTLLQ